ncbi:MAG: hypothetical protein ABWY36_06240 [Leifsonia sp.]
MAKGISISVAADTRAFSTGVKSGVLDPLEDVEKALDDVGREGEKSGRKLEDAYKDAQRDTERLEKANKDLADTIKRETTKSSKEIKSMGKEGLDDFKEESNSTAKEFAASFDGSIESVTGGIQEIAANAFSGFGPAGAAAGLVAAAGLGVVMSAITSQQEAADALKQKFEDAYKTAAEDGKTFLDAAAIQAAALDILFDSQSRKDAGRDAKLLGVDLTTMVRALAGDEEALNAAIQTGIDKREEVKAAAEGTVGTIIIEQEAVDGVIERLKSQKGIQEENKAAAEEALEVTKQLKSEESQKDAAAKAAMEQRGRDLDAYAEKVKSIPTPVFKPVLDLTEFEADLEAARRRNYMITVGVEYEKRGRFLP